MKQRADVLVVEQGLADSRSRAQALILAGAVLTADGHRVDKAGALLPSDTVLHLRDQPLPYVSRGGLKLAAALDRFQIDPRDAVCLDVGASTGGFTDCLLQRGARKVYAVDVGHNQLAYSLRQDPRVVVLEKVNVRTMPRETIPEPCSIIVADVSFISLKLVLPAALACAAPGARLAVLVKPQFEVGPDLVGKGGIVRDEAARAGALRGIVDFVTHAGLLDIETTDSPILGQKGNAEFLLGARLP